MPIYQYKCPICEYVTEESRSIEERDLPPVPVCPVHITPVATVRVQVPKNTILNLRGEGWAGGAGYK